MKELKSYLTHVTCLECDRQFNFEPGLEKCPGCQSAWLDAHYDYDAVAKIWQQGLHGRDNSLWRYAELLPLVDYSQRVSMGEGQTPLIRAVKTEKRLGHSPIFIKDERLSPTSSFKDRQAAVVVTALQEAGIRECVLASTGNAAVAYAAYCARADIKLWLFLTSMVPSAKMREAALYGAEVIKVTGTYDQAKKIAADFAAHRRIHFDQGAKAIPGKESMKTVAFEIAAGLSGCLTSGDNGCWQAPDWYLQAVSGGIGPLGVLKGFEELYKMGLIDRIPKIGIIQISGCSPMVRAFAAGKTKADPVIPETRITILSTGDPGYSYELLYRAAQTYGGHMLTVSDEEAFSAMRLLAKTEGYSVEPATAVAFAGLDKMVAQGIIKPHEVVVVNCSGHTFPVEKYIMDEDSLMDLSLAQPGETPPSGGAPLDGLGAALKRLDERVTTIVVVDDNPMDSRLIRRLLQAKKPYRVFEANSAKEGLQIIRERLPDMIVTDLTMPEMDGFALLEALKQDPHTARIPVIVVSAKDLTAEDKKRLSNQAKSIWAKGAFSTQDLVQHVVETLSRPETEAPAPPPETPPTPETVAAPDVKPLEMAEIKKIVLVEDNPMDARLISRILQMNRPLDVKQVQAGRDALKVIKAERPHLIVLDLIIPDMNGFQILDALRQDKDLDTIPVIVITSKDLSKTERQYLTSQGVFSMWRKDKLDRKKLVADVESHL